MKLTLQNSELALAINFLNAMEITKNEDSRCRSKFVKLLFEAADALGEEEKELLAQYNLLTETGEMVEEKLRDKDSVRMFNMEQRKLLKEEVVIEGGMFARNIEKMPKILRNYEGTLSGDDAYIYDRLLDEFEKVEAAG